VEGGDYQVIEEAKDLHFWRSVRKTITGWDGLASYPVMVHIIHSEMGPSVTCLIDFIIVFWNLFTVYAGEAHVTAKSRPDDPDEISKNQAVCPFLIIIQNLLEGNGYLLPACIGITFEMKLNVIFDVDWRKTVFIYKLLQQTLAVLRVNHAIPARSLLLPECISG
jgi:hypothetical protein